jgi:hypothetical protein
MYDGVGVIAGRNYKVGDIIETVPGIMVPMEHTSQTILEFYASAHIPDIDNIIFGLMYICNHHEHNSVIFKPPFEVQSKRKGFVGSSLRFPLIAVRNITKGSEIYVSYGTNEWFKQRNLTEFKSTEEESPKYPLLPGCARSNIREHRGRLFTGQAIRKGEVVEVARALIIPAHKAVQGPMQQYVWFKQNAHDLKGAILLLGNGALYRPPSSGKLGDANLNYTWFSEESYSLNNSTNISEEERLAEAISATNIECKLAMFVVFRASRDILMNEELTIPLHESQYEGLPFRQTLDHMLDPKCVS